jgi:uncharacterized membrane protein
MVSAARHSFGHYSPAAARLPRLVARGYLAAVSGPAVRASFLLAVAGFGNPLLVMDSLSEWIRVLPCQAGAQLGLLHTVTSCYDKLVSGRTGRGG